MSAILLSVLAQGALWTLMGIGIFITFRILRQPDLTAEGAFTLGAAVGARLGQLGVPPLVALLFAALAGMAAGAITALLIEKGGIQPLLAGIITVTGLYSINLMIMGSANVSLDGVQALTAALGIPHNVLTLLLGVILVLAVVGGLTLFFQTELGQALIATGDNAQMARALGIQTDELTVLGYMLGNGAIALSGYLVALDGGFADIGMGIGTVVIGLAAIILGEVLIPGVTLPVRLLTIFVGSTAYRALLAIVLALHFPTDYFKLVSAVVLAVCLAIPAVNRRFSRKEALK